jgi:Transposase DDE domain
MVIMDDALPGLKRFLKPVGLNQRMLGLVIRCVVAFVMHLGRMAAARAANSVRTQPRHRGQICRFLGRKLLRRLSPASVLREQLLLLESRLRGTFYFLVDQTLTSQQGNKTENTFSTGNRQRRPRKGRRYSKYKHARKSCHCFVKGLLITPSGIRIPFSKSYYTRDYCQAKNRLYRTQTDLAAEMIAELPLPEGVQLVVLGDTAFDAKSIRRVCDQRQYTWIVPLNPERVLAGPKGKRPKVRTLVQDLKVDQVVTVRLHAGQGPLVEQRRVSPCRVGSKVKPRTYYVHKRRQAVHSVGETQLVFSTKTKPTLNQPIEIQKILMTNDLRASAKQIVEWYSLRWQIELFFKELKSTLGFHQYRFRTFDRVEGWDELIQVTFLYLEWYRARQLQRRDLSAEKKRWWRWQRTHGICIAVRQAAELADLQQIAQRLETPSGLHRLRRCLKLALPKESRVAA